MPPDTLEDHAMYAVGEALLSCGQNCDWLPEAGWIRLGDRDGGISKELAE